MSKRARGAGEEETHTHSNSSLPLATPVEGDATAQAPPAAAASSPLESPGSNKRGRTHDAVAAPSAAASTEPTATTPLYSLPLELLHHTFEFVSHSSKAVLPLARCSCRLHGQWNDPGAWAGMAPALIHTFVLDLPHLVRHSILQHALLHAFAVIRVNEELDELLQLPHLHALSLYIPLTADQWRPLLMHPALQQLQCIYVMNAGEFNSECVRLLARLPQLRSLRLERMPADSDLTGLSLAPSLTRLSVWTLGDDVAAIMLLAQCAHLRELQLRLSPMGSELVRFFSQPQMAHYTKLQRLSLQYGKLHADECAAHLPAIFSALTNLHTLDVAFVHRMDLLLPHVALCSSLRLLRIHPYSPPPFVSCADFFIFATLLRALLTASPQLCLQLQLGPHQSNAATDAVRSHTELRALELEFVGRVTVFADDRNIMLPAF